MVTISYSIMKQGWEFLVAATGAGTYLVSAVADGVWHRDGAYGGNQNHKGQGRQFSSVICLVVVAYATAGVQVPYDDINGTDRGVTGDGQW